MMVRRLVALPLLAVLATPAHARRAYNREPEGQPPRAKTNLWQQILKPHAEEVAHLLWEGRKLRDEYAANLYEQHQQPQRKKILADAMERFLRAHELDPADSGITLELANVAFDVNDWRVAVEAYLAYRQAGEEEKQPYYVLYNLAEAHFRLRQFEEAAAILEGGVAESATWQPADRARALTLLGHIYMAENRLDDAVDVYARATSVQAYGGGPDYLALFIDIFGTSRT